MDRMNNEKLFSSVIRTNIAMLKFSGIISPEEKTIPNIILSYFLALISLIILMILTSIFAYDFVIHSAYVETIMQLFALTIVFFGGLVRYIISYYWREKIQEILKTMEELWQTLNSEERRSINLCIKSTKSLTYFFTSQCILTIFFYSIAPLANNSSNDDKNSTRTLPYAFFTEVHRSPYYEITYFLQIIMMVIITFTYVGVDMIGPLLITTVCGHFRIVQDRFQNLGRQMKVRRNNTMIENSHRQIDENSFEVTKVPGIEIWENNHLQLSLISSELRACINYHKIILTISMDIEEITNIIFLTQLIGSTYSLSAIGFKLSGNDQDKYKYSCQIFIGVLQLFICNWPPDLLLKESQAVADAAYLTDWYQWPAELKKSVHIVILRAQKPIRLTAGKFVNLSLETFGAMISSAVSFFTLLRSFN